MSGKRWATVMAALLAAYLLFAAWRGMEFVRAGGVVATLLGIAVLVLPLIGLWALWQEWRFGRATQQVGQELAEAGLLPVDDLPRRPSGRPEREPARERFEQVRQRVEQAPEDWAGWFELSVAYDWCGDRRRARWALRRAIELHPAATRT